MLESPYFCAKGILTFFSNLSLLSEQDTVHDLPYILSQ